MAAKLPAGSEFLFDGGAVSQPAAAAATPTSVEPAGLGSGSGLVSHPRPSGFSTKEQMAVLSALEQQGHAKQSYASDGRATFDLQQLHQLQQQQSQSGGQLPQGLDSGLSLQQPLPLTGANGQQPLQPNGSDQQTPPTDLQQQQIQQQLIHQHQQQIQYMLLHQQQLLNQGGFNYSPSAGNSLGPLPYPGTPSSLPSASMVPGGYFTSQPPAFFPNTAQGQRQLPIPSPLVSQTHYASSRNGNLEALQDAVRVVNIMQEVFFLVANSVTLVL